MKRKQSLKILRNEQNTNQAERQKQTLKNPSRNENKNSEPNKTVPVSGNTEKTPTSLSVTSKTNWYVFVLHN